MTNGYTTLTIGDKSIGIKFAYLCIKLFVEASEKKLDIYFSGKSMTVFGIAKLIQCAYINNCEIKETVPELVFENFHDCVEQANETTEGQQELARILKIYTDSSYNKKIQEAVNKVSEETDEKKSLTTT